VRSAVAVALAVALAAALVSCTHDTEKDRVAGVVRGYLEAFARKDTTAMARAYASTCHVRPAELRRELDRLDQPLRIDIRAIDVTLLTDTTANAVAHGTLFVGTRAFPLTGAAGNEQFHVIRTRGAWRIANCPTPAAGG